MRPACPAGSGFLILNEWRKTVEDRHDFATATEALKHDHRIIEKVLAVMEGLTKDTGEISVETWNKCLDFIRNFADKCHHLKEEKVLFPAMEEHGIDREGGPIGIMLAEHQEGRGYVKAMAEVLAESEKDPAAAKTILLANAGLYLRLLREHIQKEEEILFEMADDFINPEEQKKLLREFEEHEAEEMGSGVHERYLKMAQELENSLNQKR
jgi:hemerythrin-like domain-containing protein